MEVTVEVFDKQAQALEYLSENNEEVTEVLYGGGARGGKCLGKGTKVRMYDLSVKSVEDIAVGDVLMGDDGTPRHVLSVSTGVEQMYLVRQRNGMDYRVNESHILSLRHERRKTKTHRENGRKVVDQCEKVWETVNISVCDYLGKSGKFKKEAKGYRSFGMEFEKQDTPLDPYFLGVWLGDGTACRTDITFNNRDGVVKDYCHGVAKEYGCNPYKRANRASGCETFAYTTGKKNMKNRLLDSLREVVVLNNKHIPNVYIKNSRAVRLQLLAGLIDTDGYLHNGCYEITTKYPLLKEGLVNLCGTLGFVTRCKDKYVNGKRYDRIVIIGNSLNEIPCKVERKKCGPRKHYQNANHTGIVVEKDTVDEYYGFTIDGNHLFCLEDYTVTHNTFLGCLWQTLRRINMPGSVGLVCREESVKLKDTTIVTFFEVLSLLHYTSAVDYNATRLTATFSNGSVIYFRDLKFLPKDPEFDRLGSLGITDLFVDEAQQVCEKAISVLKGRFSVLNGKRTDGSTWHTVPKALYTCNPRRNWIYNDFVKPAKTGTLKGYRRFIKSLPVDNPHIDQAYIDNLLRADPITVQRLYFGNFEYDDDPATLCDFDAISDLFHNEHILPTGGRSCAADIAGKGHDRFVCVTWVGNVATIAVDEEYSPGKEVETTLKELMIKEKIPRSLTIVDADGVGSFLESYLNGIKEFHGGSHPLDRERYTNLRAECYFKLAELINARKIRIICTAEQRERIQDELGALKQADIDNDTAKKGIIKKEVMKAILGHSPDYMDALMMSMFFRRSKPTTGAKVKVKVRKE